MAEEKNLIEITHISKKFGDLTVLKDISVKVKEKEVVVIIGPSGSGKSTLLRCMNYLEEPTSGKVSVDGIVLDGEANINKVREEVGMVFQRFNLFPHMTVLDNIMLAPIKVRHITKAEAEDTARKLLARVGLADKADAYPSQLSGGQQQRVAIARALITKPQLVFADEPTGNLDSVSSAEVLSFLKRSVNELGQTIIMVTHDAVAASYADRAIVFADGQIVADVDQPSAEQMNDLLMKERESATQTISPARHAG